MAKVRDLGGGQNALLPVDAEASFVETAENLAEIRKVLGKRTACHQDIVKVNKYPLHITKNSVHETLECLGRIFEAERHSKELIKSKWGNNSRFLYVTRIHRDLMVPAHQVEDREDGGPESDIREGMDVWERVPVVRGGHVQLPVVPTRAPATISLRHDMQRRCPWTIRRSDNAHIDHLGELLLRHLKLLSKEPPCPSKDRWSRGRNGVVDTMLGGLGRVEG